MKALRTVLSGMAVLGALASAVSAREQIQIAGSSTVLPYSTIVAQIFKDNTGLIAVVEGGGSGAGIKQFCSGLGDNSIDIANASRPITAGEVANCKANGVDQIMQVRFGYDGIVLATNRGAAGLSLTANEVFLALARQVAVDGQIVDNPFTRWSQINPDLPDQRIMAFIPGTKHGTREVFEDKLMQTGCRTSGAADVFAEKGEDVAGRCAAIRIDGAAVDIDGDYTETLARLTSNRDAVGVFGLSFYESNTDRLQLGSVDGVIPSVETIALGEYPVSRPLYFYVKKQHFDVISGLREFVSFFVLDDLAGPGGPLADYGLVPDPELAATQKAVAQAEVMQ